MSVLRPIILLTICGVILAGLVIGLLVDTEQWIAFFVDKETHWALFVGIMAVLPIFAFPISIFLILAGIKFGFAGGVLITTLTMPVHLIASFLLAKSLLHPYLVRILNKRDIQLPQIPRNKMLVYASLFVMIPGPPYFLKNYMLALAGIPFAYYLVINWAIELAICIPVVGLGKSIITMNWKLILLFAALIAALSLAGQWLKRRFGQTREFPKDGI